MRTIIYEQVSIHVIKLSLQAAPQLSQLAVLFEDNPTLTTKQTKERIHFELKQHYKQCHDFSFVVKIHNSVKNLHDSNLDQSICISPVSVPKTRTTR